MIEPCLNVRTQPSGTTLQLTFGPIDRLGWRLIRPIALLSSRFIKQQATSILFICLAVGAFGGSAIINPITVLGVAWLGLSIVYALQGYRQQARCGELRNEVSEGADGISMSARFIGVCYELSRSRRVLIVTTMLMLIASLVVHSLADLLLYFGTLSYLIHLYALTLIDLRTKATSKQRRANLQSVAHILFGTKASTLVERS
jgi:hypothetical protein